MEALLQTLTRHSRQIRDAVLADTDSETLGRLMAEREQLIRQVPDALTEGERPTPEAIRAWEEEERGVVEALASRRDEVGRQLTNQRRVRSVETAYRSTPAGGHARYLDRAG